MGSRPSGQGETRSVRHPDGGQWGVDTAVRFAGDQRRLGRCVAVVVASGPGGPGARQTSGDLPGQGVTPRNGWSRGVARWFRLGLSVAGPFGRRCLKSLTVPRFYSPLIEPGGRVSRTGLSDKNSRLRPREVAFPALEANQAQSLVERLVGIA